MGDSEDVVTPTLEESMASIAVSLATIAGRDAVKTIEKTEDCLPVDPFGKQSVFSLMVFIDRTSYGRVHSALSGIAERADSYTVNDLETERWCMGRAALTSIHNVGETTANEIENAILLARMEFPPADGSMGERLQEQLVRIHGDARTVQSC